MLKSMKLKMDCMLFTLSQRNWVSTQCLLNTRRCIYQVDKIWKVIGMDFQLNNPLDVSHNTHFCIWVQCVSHIMTFFLSTHRRYNYSSRFRYHLAISYMTRSELSSINTHFLKTKHLSLYLVHSTVARSFSTHITYSN